MLGANMIYFDIIQKTNKAVSHYKKAEKGSMNSFDQIFKNNINDNDYLHRSTSSERKSKKMNNKELKAYRHGVTKDNIITDSEYKDIDNGTKVENDMNTDRKTLDTKIDTQEKNSYSEEQDLNQNLSEEISNLSMINELVQKILDICLNFEQISSAQQNTIINHELKEMINELESISSDITGSINVIDDLLQSKSLEFSQDIQRLIAEFENNDKSNNTLTFSKELQTLMTTLQDYIQQPKAINQNTKQNNNNELPLEDNKFITKVSNEKNTLEDQELTNNDNTLKANYLADNIDTYIEKPNASKASNEFILNHSIEINDYRGGLTENISNKVNDITSINKNSIFEQMIDQIKVDYKDLSDEVRIKLKPETLGEMTIKVVIDKGIVTAKVIVENYGVKQLLESNVEQLKDSFKEQGVVFQALDVSVNKDSNFERNNAESWTNGRKHKVQKVKIDEAIGNGLYEDAITNNTSYSDGYHNGLDLII